MTNDPCPQQTRTGEPLHWEFVVPNNHGLHIRALQLVVEIASGHPCEIQVRNVSKDGEWINAKSIMGMLTLDAAKGTRIGVRLKGPEAQDALGELRNLVACRFHEE